MNKFKAITSAIQAQGILPLFYHEAYEESYAIIRALYDGGIRLVEYTNRGDQALENFKRLIKTRDKEWPELLLGAGTIKTAKEAKAFCKAGADFIISPGTIAEVAAKVKEAGLLWIPGCMTPTEIILAQQCGATVIKLFPGNLLGPGYVRAIREIFQDLDFLPTGGIDTTKESLQAWFDAGVIAIGVGSKYISKETLAKKDYASLTRKFKELMLLVQSIKTPA